MRVLLTTRGSSGHVTPLAPFGHALVRAGHEVMVAAQDHFAANVERTGLPFAPVDAIRDEDWKPLLPTFARMGLDEGHDAMCREFFGRLDTAAMLPGLRRVAEDWRPDLIVRESWEYGSTIVAEERGIPIVRVGLGVEAIEAISGRAAAPALDRLRVAAGLPADPDGARLQAQPYLTDVPASFEDPAAPAPAQILRFRTSDTAAPAAPEAEPLVYVSFGSVTGGVHMPFYPPLYRAAIDALADLPARFLITIGEERDFGELGDVPANVEVQRWVPQDEVLHRAAAVVTHGGHGSTLGALAHGVPLVVLPLFALDQWFNAEAVARVGAGVALDGERQTRLPIHFPNEETLAGLRPAVEHVLTDPGPREAARRVAAEMAALPSVDTAPAALEQLVQPQAGV